MVPGLGLACKNKDVRVRVSFNGKWLFSCLELATTLDTGMRQPRLVIPNAGLRDKAESSESFSVGATDQKAWRSFALFLAVCGSTGQLGAGSGQLPFLVLSVAAGKTQSGVEPSRGEETLCWAGRLPSHRTRLWM